jgi:hypothetical protein
MTTRFDFLMRPRRSLMTTAWIALLVGSVPVFVVLYWHAAQEDGSVPGVANVQIGLYVVAALSYWRQKSVFTGIADGALLGNGIFSRTVRVPLDRIHRVVLVKVESRDPDEPHVQFLVLDADGRTLFRMRSQYWVLDDLRALADRLGNVVERRDPLTAEEFSDAYPGSAYWFERYPAVRMVLGAVALLVAVFAVTGLLTLAGMDTFLH